VVNLECFKATDLGLISFQRGHLADYCWSKKKF